ncbi:MAG TPA: HAD hydrolase family protein [Candidatus Saccharimonadales bacterium]|nr:HAD hydrolase family protein [Candidatus Saccharimonadales bacterium]
MKDAKIVVAISAHNESDTIQSCLESVQKSLAAGAIKARIEVCANDCSDDTAHKVREFIDDTRAKNISLIETSTRGLIRSQRLIVARNYADVYIFVDADSRLGRHTIGNLLKVMSGKTVLAYAKTELIAGKEAGFITSLYRLYCSGVMLTPRYYFHGRCFATKVWKVPSDQKVRRLAERAPRLKLYGLLLVDDIYLSAYILYKYGPKAIKEVENAKVYAYPITGVYDWWRTYRRTSVEVMKVLGWFESFSAIRHLLYRKTDWKKWRAAGMDLKAQWLIYLLIMRVFKLALKVELLIAGRINASPVDQWLRVDSTKMIRHKGPKLIFFDLDETLVSKGRYYYRKRYFINLLRTLMSEGSVIGINTNRVLSGAAPIYRELGLNGPIITEGGAIAYLPDKKGVFSELVPNNSVKGLLKKLITEEFGLYKKRYPHQEVTMSYSEERQFTQSLYVKADGELDKKEADRLRKHLASTLGEKGVVIEGGTIPGKLHAFFPSNNKVAAASIIRDAKYPGYPIFIIGDDEAGKSYRPKNTYFLGVKNSVEDYRRRCAYVASRPGARGLKQLIGYIEAMSA